MVGVACWVGDASSDASVTRTFDRLDKGATEIQNPPCIANGETGHGNVYVHTIYLETGIPNFGFSLGNE